MTKRQRDDYQARTTLHNAGWTISKQDSVKFNSGSETLEHADLKLVVCWYLKQECGYRVDTEVEMDHGEVDVVAWKENDIVLVECETEPTKDVISDKISRYVTNQPPRECWVLSVNDAPEKLMERYQWVSEEIGL
jgi:hypothetical protein